MLLADAQDELRDGAIVAYGDIQGEWPPQSRLRLVACRDFWEHYGAAASLPTLPLEEVDGVPLLFGTPQVERRRDVLVVHADIIASAFFMLTRYEEIVRRDVRDEHGRFPGKESLPYRAGFLDRPVVDEYAELLRRWLRAAGVYVKPSGMEFSVLPTHDIDLAKKYRPGLRGLFRTTASAMLGRQSVRNVCEHVGVVLRTRPDPYDTFEEMAALDAGVGPGGGSIFETPTYFFMAGGREGQAAYSLDDGLTRRAIALVQRMGAAVGLHASYDVSREPQRILEEKKALEKACGTPITRNRHHFLAWREPEEGWHLARAGITWDATLGYADVPGFRLGTCRPIRLFDPVSLKPFGIVEHPLILMDGTLSFAKYLGLDERQAFDRCRALMHRIRRHKGEFVMLWHNNSFAPAPGNYHPRLYRDLLALARGGAA